MLRMDRRGLVLVAAALTLAPVLAASCGGGDESAGTLPPIATTTTTTIVITTTTFVEVTYVVQPGDLLGNIASEFGVTMTQIMEANGLPNPDYIQAGQVLTIPPPTAPATTTTLPA